jgi:hypothetical protein
MDDARRRGRRTLLIVAAVFLLPVAIAFALYFGQLWKPAGSSNKGELIEPPRTLAVSGLRLADGTPAPAGVLQGKWSIVYVGDGACDAACREALVIGRQSRLALNNEMTRVQRVLLATANCCDTSYLAAEHPGLVALDASAPAAAALLAQFPPERDGALFIIDPNGNLMMRHQAKTMNKDLLTDLKKLLKLSHIG